MKLDLFEKKNNFFKALKKLFGDLNIPVNIIDEKSIAPEEILTKTYKDNNEAFQIMDDVIAFGMVDDAAFSGNMSESLDNVKKAKKDYDGILLFGVTLKKRSNGLLPTRTQLAQITRAFNREYYYTPVVVVFRYEDYISIANVERSTYKQEWREGEKTGKVSLLRDINIKNPHTGHLKILDELNIKGKKVDLDQGNKKKKVVLNSFDLLYKYWQEVFSVSILNKQFYKELSDWYFWAMREVYFPDAPIQANLGADGLMNHEVREHNAKNLIRLLTRILFVWFVKEKKLIPEELFDEEYIKTELLIEFEPRKKKEFDQKTQGSMYYRAILQNLFFATLNQDMGKREFRKSGKHMNVTNLMRYKSYFKEPETFIELVENVVPFMNGGLFECLDKPIEGVKGKKGGDVIQYIDGFSDLDNNPLMVPDYVFFGTEDHINLSDEYGQGKSKNKDVSVKGLIDILQSYKFTIAENTPIEEDIALDPELLGRVFENLLASYNPETKTTARKQTGSFYTPREIVNYMVDESLIAHLKNKLKNSPPWQGGVPQSGGVVSLPPWQGGVPQSGGVVSLPPWQGGVLDDKALDEKLHQLLSYDDIQPFEDEKTKEAILKAIDECKILDPACGSGAFPMGALQKMVHIIHKLDPQNERWKERQIEKAHAIDDSNIRDSLIDDIEEAFENNELDYGRKLYLIENCIYGVDIQPIAVQISKLRFFISLIVDQNPSPPVKGESAKREGVKNNLGIRPLPNLETKFVAANTLIGLDKPEAQGNLFDSEDVIKLENKLKYVRHRLFSAKTPKTKRELRAEDKKLREKIAQKLEESGWDNKTARQLADWDPYDQNASSPFFDPEWMFDVTTPNPSLPGGEQEGGFDVVIGNPPYKEESLNPKIAKLYITNTVRELYAFFIEKCLKDFVRKKGCLAFITGSLYIKGVKYQPLREFLLKECQPLYLNNEGDKAFENVQMPTTVLICKKTRGKWSFSDFFNDILLLNLIEKNTSPLEDYVAIQRGLEIGRDKVVTDKNSLPIITGSEVERWSTKKIKYLSKDAAFHISQKDNNFFEKPRIIIRETGSKIICLYMEKKLLSNRSLYSMLLRASNNIEHLKALMTILNSKVTQFYYSTKFKSDTNIFPKIRIAQAKKIPIKNSIGNYNNILSKVAEYILWLQGNCNNKLQVFESIIDALVFNLYFPDHMKERGIDVLQYVEQDMREVLNPSAFGISPSQGEKFVGGRRNSPSKGEKFVGGRRNSPSQGEKFVGGRRNSPSHGEKFIGGGRNSSSQGEKFVEFEKLSDEQKESVIDQLHKRWTDPENEVVKRMAMFKEKSPDILKPILES